MKQLKPYAKIKHPKIIYKDSLFTRELYQKDLRSA